VLDEESDEEPEPDGRQFDAVTRFEEPEEPGAGSVGPDLPEPPDPEDAVHPRVRFLFWALVAVLNLAVLAIGVGLLFVVFTDDLVLGGQILAVGLILLGYSAYRYRGARREVAALTDDEEKG
jgi:hypothetical protein